MNKKVCVSECACVCVFVFLYVFVKYLSKNAWLNILMQVIWLEVTIGEKQKRHEFEKNTYVYIV